MHQEAYNQLFIKCFKIQNAALLPTFAQKILQWSHVILYNEEPNLVATYFLEQQYGGAPYKLEPRFINANIDGEYMDVEFCESRLPNGLLTQIGHLEFDMNLYAKSKVFYIMEKVIQPIIETLDIGKVMDTGSDDKKRIIFLKNFDLVLRATADDKIIHKVCNWLEKYATTTNFFFAFQTGFGQLSKEICQYALPLRTHQITNSPAIDTLVTSWLHQYYPLKEPQPRSILSFVSFRSYMRFLALPSYYGDLHHLLHHQLHTSSTSSTNKQKYLAIRAFIIEWLQLGKSHYELIKETLFYIKYSTDIPDDTTRVYYIQEMADRAKYIEQSKKIIYHLENILAMFI